MCPPPAQGSSTTARTSLPVLGRYYFFSVTVGALVSASGTQPNNATITISHSLTGVDGYTNGDSGLYGATVTFTDAVTTPTVFFSTNMWYVSLPNNDAGWRYPFFGGGVLAPVYNATPPTLTYTFSMTSTNPNVLGEAYTWHA